MAKNIAGCENVTHRKFWPDPKQEAKLVRYKLKLHELIGKKKQYNKHLFFAKSAI
jgi:hypothetical protein